MRRTFSLQMYEGGCQHIHFCELCRRTRMCGLFDCESGVWTCETCMFGQECPNCKLPMKLEWSSDTEGADGNMERTNFTADCACGQMAGFTDLHDGRGPLRFNPIEEPKNLQSAMAAGNTIKITLPKPLSYVSTTVNVPNDEDDP